MGGGGLLIKTIYGWNQLLMSEPHGGWIENRDILSQLMEGRLKSADWERYKEPAEPAKEEDSWVQPAREEGS
jgi:hypothetical protein